MTFWAIMTCAIIMITVGVAVWAMEQPQCIKSHQQLIHVDGYQGTMLVGKILVPHHYEPYDYMGTVCDQYENRTSTK